MNTFPFSLINRVVRPFPSSVSRRLRGGSSFADEPAILSACSLSRRQLSAGSPAVDLSCLSLSLSLGNNSCNTQSPLATTHTHLTLYLRSMHTTHTQHTAGTVCRHREKPSFESTWPLSLCRCSSHSLTVVPPQHSSSSRPVGPSRNSAPDPRRQTRPRTSIS